MEWIDANSKLPDDGETVLLYMPDADGEPVWPGYFDYYGAAQWMLADGMPAGHVTCWRAMPQGPAALEQSVELKAALRALAEAQRAADFNFEQYQDAGAELNKLAEQHDDLAKVLENCRLLAAQNRNTEWGKTILRFCADVGLTGSVLREGGAA